MRHVTTTITAVASTPTATTSSTTTATSTTGTTPAPGRSALAGAPPAAVLADAARALRGAGGYAMRADLTQDHRRLMVALTTSSRNAFDATVTTGGLVTEVIRAGGGSFLRANATFWRVHAGGAADARARADRLANHWFQVPASNSGSVTALLGSLAPGTLARCLTEDHGRLSVAGHATIAGTRAIVIRDAGDAPGATPGTIAVATSGPPYPLRYTATGPSRRGGRVDVCNDGRGGDAQGAIRLSQFGRVAPIQPPDGARQAPGGPSGPSGPSA